MAQKLKKSMDVTVIGAGAGGLASALVLASQGANVRVFEALSAPGGKMGVESVDGVEFDTGPSLLTMKHVLEGLFEQAGTSLCDELDLVEHETLFDYRWPDGARLKVSRDLERTSQEVWAQFGAGAKQQFDDFMAYSEQIWDAALPNFIAGSAPSIGGMFKLGMTRLGKVAQIDPFRTMEQGIARFVTEPHLKDLLWRYATYNGSDPRRAPATLNCIAWVEMGLGGWGVKGGMAQIPRALERVGKRLGVTYHYETRVKRVMTKGRRASGVELEDGTQHWSDATVVNADVSHLVDALLPGVKHRIEPMGDSRSMSGWNGILRLEQAHLEYAHTVLFPTDYVQEFEAIFDQGAVPKDPTIYLCHQGVNHERVGWSASKTSPVFVMANAPSVEDGDSQRHAHEALRERVVSRLQEHGLMPQEGFVWERTPTQLARRFPGSKGAIYGAASNSQSSAFKRPANRVKSIPGLYLASGSAHPGGGVPLCLLSGQTSAKEALADWG